MTTAVGKESLPWEDVPAPVAEVTTSGQSIRNIKQMCLFSVPLGIEDLLKTVVGKARYKRWLENNRSPSAADQKGEYECKNNINAGLCK